MSGRDQIIAHFRRNPKYAAQIDGALGEMAKTAGKALRVALPQAKTEAMPQRGRMNKTETRFAGWLDAEKLAGRVLDWMYEPFRIRLPALRTYYVPDFVILWGECQGARREGDLTIGDTKGYERWMRQKGREKGWLKLKIAAQEFWWWQFQTIYWSKPAGLWVFKDVPRGAAV